MRGERPLSVLSLSESVDGSGPACAVGAEQTVHDARADEQIYLVQGGRLAEPLRRPTGAHH
jgi:hypothetical protein